MQEKSTASVLRPIGNGLNSPSISQAFGTTSHQIVNASTLLSPTRRRIFRKRNPIQVHPYKLEIENYKQTLKARGVRPVNVVIETQQDESVCSSDVDEGTDSQAQQPPSSLTGSANEIQSLNSQRYHRIGQPSPRSRVLPFMPDDEQELPDLTELFRNPAYGTLRLGDKRRKLTAPSLNRPKASAEVSAKSNQKERARSLSPAIGLFDLHPLSSETPPTSPQAPPEAQFKPPPQFFPQALLTSPPKSETQNPIRKPNFGTPVTDSESEPNVSAHKTRRQPIVLSDDEETSAEDSNGSSQGNLQLMKRRIKGVLPASWLKLDQQTQYKPLQAQYPRQSRVHLDHETHRGVAHKKVRSRSKSPKPTSATDHPILIPDDQLDTSYNEDESITRMSSPPYKKQRLEIYEKDLRFVHNDEDPGEDMEDDVIDRMDAPASSKYPTLKRNRKRQMRLKDAFTNQDKSNASLHRHRDPTGEFESNVKRKTHPANSTTPAHLKSKRKASPKLSIVDAISYQALSPTKIPQFLRIAARQSQRSKNRGRQSPTDKFIRLQTRQDSEEVASVLRDWREGTIQISVREQDSTEGSRLVLAEVSGNQREKLPAANSTINVHWRQARPSGNQKLYVQTRLQPMVSVTETQQIDNGTPKPKGSSKAKVKSHLQARRFRDAQLEVPENDFEWTGRQAAFSNMLREANRDFDAFDRFHSPRASSRGHTNVNRRVDAVDAGRRDTENVRKFTRPGRVKSHARRLDVETKEYRQPDFATLLEQNDTPQTIHISSSDEQILIGLGPYGSRYPRDFDVRPLEQGTYFHQSTFIGSGEFQQALLMEHRDLDAYVGDHTTRIMDVQCTWSAWNENMASGLQHLFDKMERTVEIAKTDEGHYSQHELTSVSKLPDALRSVISNNSKWLSFSDPVDRTACATKFKCLLTKLTSVIVEQLHSQVEGKNRSDFSRQLTRVLFLQLSLASQVLAILKKATTSFGSISEIQQMITTISRVIVHQLMRSGLDRIREFFENNRRHRVREAGVREDQVELEAILTLWHILNNADDSHVTLWTVFNDEVLPNLKEKNHVRDLDRIWHDLFTVLPILELDRTGIFNRSMLITQATDNWDAVKSIMVRVFELYTTSPHHSNPSINEYLRTMIARCHVLVHNWSWRRCESPISVIFDFFAKNGLASLCNEAATTSPKFLEQLHLQPSLEISSEDKAFHIFLKLVATGLLGMRDLYSNKKIRSIVWRWIPNHGRTNRKDEPLKQKDLNALRNHHDLLCTLYWSSPPGFRPRLDLIQNLVDHASSHREACRLSIRAWTNLVKFQISTDESSSFVEPFAIWFKDIINQTMTLYRTARTEAESHYEAAHQRGELLISTTLLERTISGNQHQVLASVSDALAGMKGAIELASSPEHAVELLQNSDLPKIFTLFDAKNKRLSAVMIEALDIYLGFMDLLKRKEQVTNESSEESQDYGDWPDVEQDSPVKPRANVRSIDFIYEPVADFLSNCFGAESAPEDSLLMKIVAAWTKLAAHQVRRGVKDWTDFLDPCSRQSWGQLRDTEQKRKFTPYFFSSVLDCDSTAFRDNAQAFISAWLVSLVERDSMLKFQDRLTNALLDNGLEEALVHNLPFVKLATTQRYNVSLRDLTQRRLAVISTVFSNMQRNFYNTMADHPSKVVQTRREYSEYLKQLMSAMKVNYLELVDSDVVNGSYVEFVQAVVEFLQQYTADICAIDKFFTDSTAFPLPAEDPAYVVGRLKGYTAKLSDAKHMKQLSVFIQNISERAAVDNQQPYLVDQLVLATASQYESTDPTCPTLRGVLTQAIFPAYITFTLRTATGWIMAHPILQVCAKMFGDLLYRFSVNDRQSVRSVLLCIITVLHALQQSMELLVDHSGLFDQSYTLHTLQMMFAVITSSLPTLDYIIRSTGDGHEAATYVRWFKSFSIFALEIILGREDVQAPDFEEELVGPKSMFPDLRNFSERELNQELSSRWTWQGGKYYLLRGNTRKELLVDPGSVEDGCMKLVSAIEELHTILENFESLDTRREYPVRTENDILL